ncbi:hypothetical protein ES705_30979 [subsurface metagenome]
MKNTKLLFFIICLIFFLNLIFFNCSFATLYIVKDQEGNNICITNQEKEISKYKLLGYEIYILGGSGQEISESTENEISQESQIIPETENIPESNIISLTKVNLVDFNSSFSPKGDFVNIQGTLRNNGKEIINNAEINVKCKNKKGKIMLIESTSCQPLSIAPGSEAYFNLKLDNTERISSFRIFLFDKYLITKYLKTLQAKAKVVNWSSNLSKAGDYIYLEDRGNILIKKYGDFIFINGTIENVGDGFMSKTRIDVQGLDSLGRLVSTNSSILNPQEIGPKQTSSFMCALSRGILIDRFIIDINWINPQGNRANHNEIELKK